MAGKSATTKPRAGRRPSRSTLRMQNKGRSGESPADAFLRANGLSRKQADDLADGRSSIPGMKPNEARNKRQRARGLGFGTQE